MSHTLILSDRKRRIWTCEIFVIIKKISSVLQKWRKKCFKIEIQNILILIHTILLITLKKITMIYYYMLAWFMVIADWTLEATASTRALILRKLRDWCFWRMEFSAWILAASMFPFWMAWRKKCKEKQTCEWRRCKPSPPLALHSVHWSMNQPASLCSSPISHPCHTSSSCAPAPSQQTWG